MELTICQSCAMPMTQEEHFGKNIDGTKNEDYCAYCIPEGVLDSECTMEEMIETCIPFALEAGVYKDAEEAREGMKGYFPTLKRWQTSR